MGVISVLIGLLLPVLGKARRNANDVYCRSNLKQIAYATRMYANDNFDRYPDGYTLGGAFVRVLPGMLGPNDPFAVPEVYGLPALYKQLGYLKDVKVWRCPSAREDIQAWGNTYIWALLGGNTLQSVTKPDRSNIARWTSIRRNRPNLDGEANDQARPKNDDSGGNNAIYWVYDNFTTLPWTSGSRRTTGSAGTFAVAEQSYPHQYSSPQVVGVRQGSINVCFLDGHVGVVAYVKSKKDPTSKTPDNIVIRSP